MPNSYSLQQIIMAMQAAEREHPPPARWVLSRQVAVLGGIYGLMSFMKWGEIVLKDPQEIQLVEVFLAKAEERS